MRLLRELQVAKDLEVIDLVDHFRSLGWTYRETAAKLGMNINTLYLAYRRALRRRDAQRDIYDRAYKDLRNGLVSGTGFTDLWKELIYKILH